MNKTSSRLIYNGSVWNLLSFIIILISLFVTFCSLNKSSYGSVCAVFSVILILINLTKKSIIEWLPFAVACALTTILLMLSGQASERGFNAPILHALKFVYLMFTVALSIGIMRLPLKEKKIVLHGVLVSVFISACISLYYVIFVDKYAIRYYEARGFTLVFDFSQFYSICLLLCVLFFGIISHGKRKKIKYIILCAILLACVGFSLYVTGVILTVLGLVLAFALYKYNKSKSKAALWAMVAIMIVIGIFAFGNQISDWIYNITENFNWILRDRIRSVVDMVLRTDHNLVYSYARRDELANYSLNTFRQYPLFGIGYKGYGYGIIGCHQEWQDMLGVFGIIGTLIFVLLLIYLSKCIYQKIKNKTDAYSFGLALLLFGVLGFLNPCLSLPVLSIVFIIAPNISALFETTSVQV